MNYHSNKIEIETGTYENRLLVLLDSYYPGWSAFVDTVQTPVIAANFVYRAINLPQGHHRVIFHYEPESFVYGAAVSGCTALLWGIVWVVSLARRSAQATRSQSRM